jgi:Transposase DDE domain
VGRLVKVLRRLAEDLLARGQLDLAETFIDASFSGTKKGGGAIGPTRRGKGSKIMAIPDRHGFPVAVGIASASPHETKLVEATLQQRFTRKRPQRLIGDLAYDSAPLDQRLRRRGVRLIAPHKGNRVRQKPRTGASFAAIAAAGGSNACLLGCITFAVWSSAGRVSRGQLPRFDPARLRPLLMRNNL